MLLECVSRLETRRHNSRLSSQSYFIRVKRTTDTEAERGQRVGGASGPMSQQDWEAAIAHPELQS
jgi:hypothetical protein